MKHKLTEEQTLPRQGLQKGRGAETQTWSMAALLKNPPKASAVYRAADAAAPTTRMQETRPEGDKSRQTQQQPVRFALLTGFAL